MRDLIVGIVSGTVVGIVIGTTLVAPRLELTTETPPVFRAKLKTSLDQPSQKEPFVKNPNQFRSKPFSEDTNTGWPGFRKNKRTQQWRMASAYASHLPQLGGLATRLETQISGSSDMKLSIKFFEPGTLVATSDAFDAVRSGTIEAAFAAPGLWAEKNTALHLYSAIPFGPQIQEYLAWLHADGVAIMNEIYQELGVHGIVCGVLAPEGSGWFREPIRSLDQLRSVRFGMMGLGSEVLTKLGTRVVAIAEADVFQFLEGKLIDGAEAAQPTIDLSLGLHRLAKHYYFPGWHQPATLLNLVVNLNVWNALPSALQRRVQSICGDNVQHGLAHSAGSQFTALRSLVAKGVLIETWPPEIMIALRQTWHEIAQEKSRENRDFKRTWNSLRRFREEYAIWREIGHIKNQ